MLAKVALTITALAATTLGAPLDKRRVVDEYIFYSGDGSTALAWPAQSDWGSYEDLWAQNYHTIQNACDWNGWAINNSEREIADINTAIHQVAAETTLDPRFILAIVLQESVGCVRAPTTNNGVINPGLMQSHNGAGTCSGLAEDTCTYDMILQMVRDGSAGTAYGDGLVQLLQRTQGELAGAGGDARAFYAAARLYNSGSVDYSNLGNGFSSIACYASNIANRFTGWSLSRNNCQL